MCMCECALRMWQCSLYSSSATITAASTATEIKPELHVRFDCLVLSYRKLYANLTAKSNLHNEMKNNNKKKSLTDALKAFLKRKEGEKERVIAYTTQHTEQKNHDGKSEWGIGLAMQRGCLFVALLLLFVVVFLSIDWMSESQSHRKSLERKEMGKMHMQVHMTFKAIAHKKSKCKIKTAMKPIVDNLLWHLFCANAHCKLQLNSRILYTGAMYGFGNSITKNENAQPINWPRKKAHEQKETLKHWIRRRARRKNAHNATDGCNFVRMKHLLRTRTMK